MCNSKYIINCCNCKLFEKNKSKPKIKNKKASVVKIKNNTSLRNLGSKFIYKNYNILHAAIDKTLFNF